MAKAERRSNTIGEVIADLRRIALPYFEQFDDLDQLIVGLLKGEVAEVGFESAVELLICYRDKTVAAAYVRECLNRRPEFRPEVASLVDAYRRSGVPQPRCTGYAIELATLIVSLTLDVQVA